MTLLDVISKLDTFPEEDTIYAAEPWSPQTEALVLREPNAGGRPVEAGQKKLKYFIEISIAREFLEGWERSSGQVPDRQKCRRLIEYAINDA